MINIIIALAAYLIGSINFSILISRYLKGQDIRQSGSGNAGATNMLRTYGKKMGILTLVLDLIKGIIVVVICRITNVGEPMTYVAGVCVALGHNFPLYFKFKGGKGVATSLGVVLVLNPLVGLLVAVIGVSVIAATRYVSLGSIIGGAVFIVAQLTVMAVSGEFNLIVAISSIILGGLLILRHRTNIVRLLNGAESKLGSK